MTPRPILKNFPPQTLAIDPNSSEYYASHSDLFTPYTGALPFSSTRIIPPLESPHVHFPPTPILSQMGMTHSSYSYDRHPIEVQPNSLALPQRNARAVDVPIDEDGYFPMTEDTIDLSSSIGKSMLLDPDSNLTPTYPAPFEDIQNHTRNLSDYTIDRSTTPNELSGSISISVHFSRRSTQSHAFTRQRNLEDYHFEHAKKPMARRNHSFAKTQVCVQEVAEADEEEDTTIPPSPSSMSGSYSLGLGRVLNRTKHSMDAIIGDSSSGSSSVGRCGTHFASFCDPGLEGCLGGF